MTYDYWTAIFLITVTSVVYAVILRLEDLTYIALWKAEHTWQTVVVGVGYTIFFMWPVVGTHNALLWFGAFAVGGIFMGAQSIFGNINRTRNREQGDDDIQVR